MNSKLLVFCLLSLGVGQPGPALAGAGATGEPADPGGEVRAVFTARCIGCHGPDLPKPKGRFGYVLDLTRVASNPEMVIPFKPEESELWELVRRSEMPPADAPSGPLTAREKESIRAWIAAGAPREASSPTPSSPPANTQPEESVAPEHLTVALAQRVLRWLGKFHVLLVHFPIALLVAAAVGECWSVWRGARFPSEAVRFCLFVGAVAAVPTVVLGWLHALGGYGAGAPGVLFLHRWLGTVAGVCLVVLAIFSELDARRGTRSLRVHLLLFVGALLIGLSGHFGGILVHGQDFFDW